MLDTVWRRVGCGIRGGFIRLSVFGVWRVRIILLMVTCGGILFMITCGCVFIAGMRMGRWDRVILIRIRVRFRFRGTGVICTRRSGRLGLMVIRVIMGRTLRSIGGTLM